MGTGMGGWSLWQDVFLLSVDGMTYGADWLDVCDELLLWEALKDSTGQATDALPIERFWLLENKTTKEIHGAWGRGISHSISSQHQTPHNRS